MHILVWHYLKTVISSVTGKLEEPSLDDEFLGTGLYLFFSATQKPAKCLGAQIVICLNTRIGLEE